MTDFPKRMHVNPSPTGPRPQHPIPSPEVSVVKHRLSRSAVAALPTGSAPELLLAVQLEQDRIMFQREYQFDFDRKFRADFYIPTGPEPESGLLIEVEGGAWVNGRHSRGAGMEADCEKSALAAIRGYRVMRVTPAQVNDGRALAWIKAALA